MIDTFCLGGALTSVSLRCSWEEWITTSVKGTHKPELCGILDSVVGDPGGDIAPRFSICANFSVPETTRLKVLSLILEDPVRLGELGVKLLQSSPSIHPMCNKDYWASDCVGGVEAAAAWSCARYSCILCFASCIQRVWIANACAGVTPVLLHKQSHLLLQLCFDHPSDSPNLLGTLHIHSDLDCAPLICIWCSNQYADYWIITFCEGPITIDAK